MPGVEATTWDAVGVTLTVVGLLISVLVWRRRGAASGLRAAAWSMLPAAAGLTGTLRLIWEIFGSISRWAVRLVFDPFMWLGIALAGVAVVLFGATAVMRARGIGRRGSKQPRGAVGDKRAAQPAGTADGDDDMADIEALLKKHGIT